MDKVGGLSEENERVLRPPWLVLVADDDPAIRFIVRRTIENLNMCVIEAADGREVLEVLAHTPVDLLILDLVMPNCEGIETIGAIRAGNQSLPILAISGAFEGTMLHLARRLGADIALPKPFSAVELADAVLLLQNNGQPAAER